MALNEKTERGPKEKEGKIDWSVFPFEEGEEVAQVFTQGAQKYGGAFTYRRGIPIEELWSATFRHLMEIRKGRMYDKEDGLSHFAHISANGLMGISQLREEKRLATSREEITE